MDFGTIIGFIVGSIAIFGVACRGDVLPYFDLPSVGLVFGGCLTSVLISVPMSKLAKMPKTAMMAFKTHPVDLEGIIHRLVEFSEVARKDGILALESIIDQLPDPLMRRGLQLAVDGTDPDVISDVMTAEVEGIERRHDSNRKGWELCRAAAPSWGAMGTVIGLVQMVKGGVEDPNALIMGVAVALLTTFYGSLVSSWLVGPVCDKLAANTEDEMLAKIITMNGVLSIQAGDNPRLLAEKLRVYLPPDMRGENA